MYTKSLEKQEITNCKLIMHQTNFTHPTASELHNCQGCHKTPLVGCLISRFSSFSQTLSLRIFQASPASSPSSPASSSAPAWSTSCAATSQTSSKCMLTRIILLIGPARGGRNIGRDNDRPCIKTTPLRPTSSLFVETHGSLWTEKVIQPRAPEKVSLALAHTQKFFLFYWHCAVVII